MNKKKGIKNRHKYRQLLESKISTTKATGPTDNVYMAKSKSKSDKSFLSPSKKKHIH